MTPDDSGGPSLFFKGAPLVVKNSCVYSVYLGMLFVKFRSVGSGKPVSFLRVNVRISVCYVSVKC